MSVNWRSPSGIQWIPNAIDNRQPITEHDITHTVFLADEALNNPDAPARDDLLTIIRNLLAIVEEAHGIERGDGDDD